MKPGIYPDIPAAMYHAALIAEGSLSCSTMDLLL